MQPEVVSSEHPVKNIVATTASTVAASPEQLARQAKDVADRHQEWIVSGRKTSEAIIDFCEAFEIFQKDADRAKNTMVKEELAKTLRINSSPEQAQRYRAIGGSAKSLRLIQNNLPPTVESIYEVARALASGKDADKQNVLAAVKDGLLTIKSSLQDIRNLRRDGQLPTPRKEGRTPARITPVDPAAMTDGEIVEQAKAQGIVTPEAQQTVVKQAEATSADAPEPAVIDATPSNEVSEAAYVYRLGNMTFSDFKRNGTTITGRFTITNAEKSRAKWPTMFLANLVNALNQPDA